MERGPGTVTRGSGLLLLHQALRGLVHEGPNEPAGCRHRRSGGWSERSVTKMVETYGHATDDRRLDEIDAAFQTQIQTQASPIPQGEPS
jgi:hypothetical protein